MLIIYFKIIIGIEKNQLENTIYYNVLTILLESFMMSQLNLILKLKTLQYATKTGEGKFTMSYVCKKETT